MLVLAVYFVKAFVRKPPIHLDENGIENIRLGLGRIPWSDIRSLKLDKSFGVTILWIKLYHPDKHTSSKHLLLRLFLAIYRFESSGDMYIDLTELRADASVVRNYIESSLHSEDAA